MDEKYIFSFKADLSGVEIPEKLNNPFGSEIPGLGIIAATEFQEYITEESPKWEHDFRMERGKMFGVLAVQREDQTLGYIGTISGKLNGKVICEKFIPSIFDDLSDQSFIDDSMKELKKISREIDVANSETEVQRLKMKRKEKSVSIQRQLFAGYEFLNRSGRKKNVLDVFRDASLGNPPSAAGECAAPKLLHFAFKHRLRPFSLAEFWWGNPLSNKARVHRAFYPACKNKCKPILEFMLEDSGLYERANDDIEN